MRSSSSPTCSLPRSSASQSRLPRPKVLCDAQAALRLTPVRLQRSVRHGRAKCSTRSSLPTRPTPRQSRTSTRVPASSSPPCRSRRPRRSSRPLLARVLPRLTGRKRPFFSVANSSLRCSTTFCATRKTSAAWPVVTRERRVRHQRCKPIENNTHTHSILLRSRRRRLW